MYWRHGYNKPFHGGGRLRSLWGDPSAVGSYLSGECSHDTPVYALKIGRKYRVDSSISIRPPSIASDANYFSAVTYGKIACVEETLRWG